MTLFLCLASALILPSCARNARILRSDQREWIIPKGETFNGIYDGKLREYTAEDDLVVMFKGRKLKLEQEANQAVMK